MNSLPLPRSCLQRLGFCLPLWFQQHSISIEWQITNGCKKPLQCNFFYRHLQIVRHQQELILSFVTSYFCFCFHIGLMTCCSKIVGFMCFVIHVIPKPRVCERNAQSWYMQMTNMDQINIYGFTTGKQLRVIQFNSNKVPDLCEQEDINQKMKRQQWRS